MFGWFPGWPTLYVENEQSIVDGFVIWLFEVNILRRLVFVKKKFGQLNK